MAYDGGSIVATYIMDISDVEAKAAQLRAIFNGIRANETSLGASLPKVPAAGGASVASQIARQRQIANELERRANIEARLTQVQNTDRNSLTGLTQAAQIYSTALQKLTVGSDAYLRVQTQLQTIQNRIAKVSGGGGPALPRTLEEFGEGALNQIKTGLLGIIGPAALVATGLNAIRGSVSGGIEAGKDALALRETKNALLAVSGSTKVYADALATARQQQVLFGGSIQENVEGLQGLVVTARDSGAELQSLVDLAQRLDVKSPEQGISGARVSLANAFGEGNITSLARRFEIPKDKIRELGDTTIPVAERVKVLSDYLDSIGISSAAVAGKVDADALAFRRLGQEVGDARIKAGDGLATAFAGTATGLSRLLGIYNGNPQAFAEIRALLEGKSGVTQGDIDAQAKNLRVAGASRAEDAARLANTKAAGFDTAKADQSSAALDRAHDRLIVLAASSDEMRDRVVALYNQFGQTQDIDAFTAGVRTLETAQTRGSRSSQDAITSLQKLRNEIADSADASVTDASKKDVQSAATELLAAKSQLAVDQFLRLNPNIDASKVASLAAAQGYDPQIRQLIEMAAEAGNAKDELLKLNNAQAQGKLDQLVKLRSSEGIGSGRGGGSDAAGEGKAFADILGGQATEAKKLLDDQIAYAKAMGNTATARKLLNQELATAKRDGDLGEQARIIDQLKSLEKTRVSSAQSTALSLQNLEQNSGLQLVRTLRENNERLLDAQQEYDLKRTRSTEDFQERYESLLAHGQRAQAAQAKREFEKEQERAAQDFRIQRLRTIRNNEEGLGDIGDRTDLRSGQIGQRAALRGVPASIPPPAVPVPIQGGASASAPARVIQVTLPGTLVMPDGQVIANITYPFISARLDDDLSIEIRSATPPGSAQTAVSGSRP